MNKKRGVSLIVVIIAIAIILVISATAVFEGKSILTKAKKRELATDFYLMSKAISDYEFANSKLPVSSTVSLPVPEDAKEQFQNEPDLNNSGKIELKYIDYSKLNTENLVRGLSKEGADDRYAVSEWTGRLYYLKGEKIGNDVYYTLTDDLQKLLDINNVK